MNALLSGVPIRVIPDIPKLMLSNQVTVSPQFRKEFDAWLLEMFPSNTLRDNEVICVGGALLMNPRTWAKVKVAIAAEKGGV